jgi:hypothetical protein
MIFLNFSEVILQLNKHTRNNSIKKVILYEWV